jgi:hypothetical protein
VNHFKKELEEALEPFKTAPTFNKKDIVLLKEVQSSVKN